MEPLSTKSWHLDVYPSRYPNAPPLSNPRSTRLHDLRGNAAAIPGNAAISAAALRKPSSVFSTTGTVVCQSGGTSSLIIKQNRRGPASRTICSMRPVSVAASSRYQPSGGCSHRNLSGQISRASADIHVALRAAA